MSSTRQVAEYHVAVENATGEGAKLLELLANANVNLLGLVGYSVGPTQAFVHVLPENPAKAAAALESAGYKFEKDNVVLTEIEDHPGAVAAILRKLADGGIALEHCYATRGAGGTLLSLRTNDDSKALALLL